VQQSARPVLRPMVRPPPTRRGGGAKPPRNSPDRASPRPALLPTPTDGAAERGVLRFRRGRRHWRLGEGVAAGGLCLEIEERADGGRQRRRLGLRPTLRSSRLAPRALLHSLPIHPSYPRFPSSAGTSGDGVDSPYFVGLFRVDRRAAVVVSRWLADTCVRDIADS